MEIDSLWNYHDPAQSEQRFRAALEDATGDAALNLRTQIARTFSLRGMFPEAHAELDAIADALRGAGTEPRVRALLERGRTFRSAGQLGESAPLFREAFDLADSAGLQALAADALHMLPLTETTLAGQRSLTQKLIDYARAATDPKARHWEAPGLHNLGVALNEAGLHEEALAAFREALAVRERLGKISAIRIARWMIAHTLRLLGRVDEALVIQLDLLAQFDAAGEPDPCVYEELTKLHEAHGDTASAERYRELHRKADG